MQARCWDGGGGRAVQISAKLALPGKGSYNLTAHCFS